MTHDLDKLEAAIKCKDEKRGTMKFIREHGEHPNQCIKNAARAHLAAQRQGGDAAVTVDRGALDALDSLVEDAKAGVELEYPEHPALEHKRNRAFTIITECEQTLRTALLSAQAGVPGEVIAQMSQFIYCTLVLDGDKLSPPSLEWLKEASEIASPYLNTNDGRE